MSTNIRQHARAVAAESSPEAPIIVGPACFGSSESIVRLSYAAASLDADVGQIVDSVLLCTSAEADVGHALRREFADELRRLGFNVESLSVTDLQARKTEPAVAAVLARSMSALEE